MMKDVNEVLRKKEVDLQELHREVEALRIAARLLSDQGESATTYTRPATPASSYAAPTRPAPLNGSIDAGYGASWDAAKKFP
jgi:hypothetical protein